MFLLSDGCWYKHGPQSVKHYKLSSVGKLTKPLKCLEQTAYKCSLVIIN